MAAEGTAVKRVTAPVRGMHCAACVGKVERALRGVGGVEQASVNLATERASVAFDPATTDFGALQSAVSARGLRARDAVRGAAGRGRRARRHGAGGRAARVVAQGRRRRGADGADRRRQHDRDLLVGARVASEPVAPSPAVDAGAVVGGGVVPSRLPARPPLSLGQHGHPGVDRDQRRVALQRRRHAVAARVHGARRDAVLRDVRGRDHAGRPRAMAGGAGARPHLGGDPPAGEPRAARRPASSATGRRSTCRPTRWSSAISSAFVRASACPSTASSSRAGRRVDESMLTGESLPVDQGGRRSRVQRHAQPHRQLRHARHARRRRHHAGPDHPPRGRGPGLTRTDPAPRRPCGRGVRAGRSRASPP